MAGRPLTILAIDDDPGDIELLRRHLEDVPEFAVRFVACHNTAAGRTELAKQAVDVIILDYLLRRDTGLEFLQELRDNGYRHPIIMLTGKGDERIAAHVMRTGADDYLIKEDLSPEMINHSLRFVLSRFENERQRMENEAELTRLARFDELTGLYNRRYLLDRLTQEMLRAQRYSSPLCIMMIDLDHFKRVNDTYGHIMGDTVLTTAAEIIRQTVRTTDIPGRYGGEELCVVLTETNLEGAYLTAERLRQGLAAVDFPASEAENFRVTCSIGLAQYGPHMPDVVTLLNTADRALYQAKGAGRNRVIVAPTAP